jgi:hypothetical protein
VSVHQVSVHRKRREKVLLETDLPEEGQYTKVTRKIKNES